MFELTQDLINALEYFEVMTMSDAELNHHVGEILARVPPQDEKDLIIWNKARVVYERYNRRV